jgi:hypothetical protein
VERVINPGRWLGGLDQNEHDLLRRVERGISRPKEVVRWKRLAGVRPAWEPAR